MYVGSVYESMYVCVCMTMCVVFMFCNRIVWCDDYLNVEVSLLSVILFTIVANWLASCRIGELVDNLTSAVYSMPCVQCGVLVHGSVV